MRTVIRKQTISIRTATVSALLGVLLLAACDAPLTDSASTNSIIVSQEQALVGRQKAKGEPCTDKGECASGLCLRRRQGGVCVPTCSVDADCPDGLVCGEWQGLGDKIQLCVEPTHALRRRREWEARSAAARQEPRVVESGSLDEAQQQRPERQGE